ncbi:MAG: biotin--[acetyl-CoA-carboxylase] ligase [candidate division WOR-3 bacterium]|nr:biotin--[acetyl-CoA-carboxylase] ligase [candidate division WOR-3 bacterium]
MPKIIKLEEVDSTNEWIKKNRKRLSDLDSVIAITQTAGKGRGSNRWFSPPGGLWLSLMIEKFPGNRGSLSLASSVATAETLENYGLEVHLKWPNDIIVNSKKIGGVLIEKAQDGLVVGIGLNLNVKNSDFPDFLHSKIITAKEVIKKNLPIEEVAKEIIKRIDIGRNELERIYVRYLSLNQDIGRMVKIVGPKETFKGRVMGIQLDGGIRIEKEGFEKIFYSGKPLYI